MQETTLAHPKIASQEEWRAERLQLLEKEKAVMRQHDAVNAERRRLPMVKIDKQYEFDSPSGKISLAELFEGMDQLIVYHFMFDPEWEEGCPGCTGFVNSVSDISSLAKRRTRFAVVSRAPLPKLEEYKAKHGWSVPWVSSFGSDFNYDFHVTLDPEKTPVEYNYRDEAQLRANGMNDPTGEVHGLSVFFRIGDDVYHTYSTYARGVEDITDSYSMLDVTPYGRQEDWEDSPPGWPQKPTYG